MMSQTMKNMKHIWEIWDIRVLMVVSLGLQILLTCLAPFRKSCAGTIFKSIMWCLYLSANATAAYTIGLISSAIGDAPSSDFDNGSKSSDLLPFWSPFLLLHLGGPDTITALALEDNELWHRQALSLVTQVVVTLYVFGRSFHDSKLVLPTVLMSLNGLVKYVERISALYFASFDSFRESLRKDPEPGPNYARLMEEYSSAANANIPADIQDGPRSGSAHGSIEKGVHYSEQELSCPKWRVIQANHFFNKFKGLLADSILSLKERDESRNFFIDPKIDASIAFSIIEIELNLMYDIFYTKAFLLQSKMRYLRLFSFFPALASSSLFWFRDESNYDLIDVRITFTLLGGALALDIIAVLVFMFSDWWIILLSSNHDCCSESETSRWRRFHELVARFRSETLVKWCANKLPRWSKSISSYNLLNRCLDDHPTLFKLVCIKKVKELLVNWIYVCSDKKIDKVQEFIAKELKMKASKLAKSDQEAIAKVCAARGNLVLQDKLVFVSEFLRPWTVDLDYDESVLTWHLATDICYLEAQGRETVSTDNDSMEISKKLSDYMSYLMLRRQALVSSVVGMSDIRFEDTIAEVAKFLDGKDYKKKQLDWKLKDFCRSVLDVKTEVRPIVAKGDKSKSVLFDACRLAKQLRVLGKEQWEITSKVWVELLCFAALRCSPRHHIAQLRKGGELVTLVWLLMVHLGIGDHFRQNQGYGWTKLIIYK